MRFRVSTRPPLPPVKAWFSVSDDANQDIDQLKHQLCSRIPALHDRHVVPANITLSIDNFELLDETETDIIRENDLVQISANDRQKKRAGTDYEPPRKRVKRQSQSTSDSSTSRESSSSSDANTSSTDSESENGSDSSTASSSGSSVETQEMTQPAKATTLSQRNACYTVPPGHGKQSTRNRNARRRLKRLYEKEKSQVELLASKALSNGSANATPLGVRQSNPTITDSSTSCDTTVTLHQDAQVVSEHPDNFVAEVVPAFDANLASTLRNKNKKKGFKRSMTGLVPSKIVFEDATPGSQSTPVDSIPPRLVTPSEKQELGLLPSNMFVTSVEVEREKRTKKRKKAQDSQNYGADLGNDWADNDQYLNEIPRTDSILLDYGDPDSESRSHVGLEMGITKPGKSHSLRKYKCWIQIEKTWESSTPICDIAMLKNGSVIGWKSLAIDPITFTPEMLLHLGHVKEVNHSSASVVLIPIRRPGASNIAFGFRKDDFDENEVEEEVEVEENETVQFQDLLAGSVKNIESVDMLFY